MKNPRKTGAPVSTEAVDPRENPGSYTKHADGTFTRNDPLVEAPTGASEAAPAPRLPEGGAQAIADALADLGHECPPALVDQLTEPVCEPEGQIETPPESQPFTPPFVAD